MRKIYSFLLVALLAMVSQTAMAWSYSLPSENKVLDSVYHYQMYRYYDFFNGMSSATDYFTDGQGNRVSGDGCFTLSTDAASFKLNGFAAYQVASPVEMSNFYIQIGTAAINLRAGISKDGLHNYGSGSRYLAIADVKKGQIIVCQWGVNSGTNIIQPSSAISGADACTWTDISESIHAQQIEAGTTYTWDYDPEYPGDEEHAKMDTVPGTADAFTYWKAESDGYFVIEMQRYAAIQGIQIWIDATADEAVSSPTMKLAAVNGTGRSIELTAGNSTLGNTCNVWYGIEDDPALYLEDTDEVLRADTTFVTDSLGNPTEEIADITYIYKQKLSEEDWAAGVAGSNEYDGSYVEISADDDTDGDGYVTLHAATVSSTGNFSDVVDYKIAVGEITLNAPTMTLIGLDGIIRKYQIGWTNNTLCGEDYSLLAVVDGEEQMASIGDTFEAEQSIGAKVTADGYNDGVLDDQEVVSCNVSFSRKNAAKAAAGQHDWDFVNRTADEYQMLMGTYSDTIAYIRPNAEYTDKNDTTFYTRAEFAALVADGTLAEADGTPWNPKDCGWTYDSTKSRGTLNVIEGGNDQNSNGYGYVDGEIDLFNNGMSVSCPPNTNNASCIFLYNNADLGCYFMSKPTLTFSREAAQYGEYVLMYLGQGGSNYTNTRWPALYEVPADSELSTTLPSGGIHLFYVDVYTPEDLPADQIEEVRNSEFGVKGIYDLSGRRVTRTQHGIYIVNGKKVVK